MNDDLSYDVKVAIQRAILFHPLFEGTAAEALEIAIAAIKAGDEICASSPAQEPVTTEPVAWTNEAQLGFLKEPGYQVVPMAMWAFQHSAHPIALYTIPAPPQPGRDAVIEECAQAIMSLRQSGATIFDAKHSGQRGEDRSTALRDAVNVVRALIGEPK